MACYTAVGVLGPEPYNSNNNNNNNNNNSNSSNSSSNYDEPPIYFLPVLVLGAAAPTTVAVTAAAAAAAAAPFAHVIGHAVELTIQQLSGVDGEHFQGGLPASMRITCVPVPKTAWLVIYQHAIYGWLSKSWSFFGSLLQYGT